MRRRMADFPFIIREFNLEVQLGHIELGNPVAAPVSFTPGFSQVILRTVKLETV
jgi:hypothetical protein